MIPCSSQIPLISVQHYNNTQKDNKIKIYVDFKDLNKASSKGDFSLPHIDVLVDNTAKSSTYSFMYGFYRYNHIKMAEQDKEKTTFITL